MHERGYEAVGVAELCRRADVRKGSFYHFFSSKQDLALEMLDRAWAWARVELFGPTLGDLDLDAIAAFEAYGQRLVANLRAIEGRTGSVVGCRFGNFATELATVDPAIRDRTGTILDEMAELMAAAIARGVAAGQLAPDVDAATAGRELLAHMEGLMVLAKARQDPEILGGLGSTARRLLTPA